MGRKSGGQPLLGNRARGNPREQLRSLSRLLFLLFGVTVATMLLLWGFALQSGFDKLLTSGVTDTYDFVYEYTFDELRYEPLPAGAEPTSSALFVPVGDDTRSFYVTGIMPNSSMLTLVDETGARLSTDQVIITRPLANQLKATPGSTVTIVRKLDGRIFTLQIDRIAETYSGKFIFMPWAEFNRSFGMPEGSYNGAFSNVLLDLPADQSYSVVTLEEKIAGVREAIAPTRVMVGVLATLAFIIGVIVISVVTSLMVEESRQTITSCRSCCAGTRSLRSR